MLDVQLHYVWLNIIYNLVLVVITKPYILGFLFYIRCLVNFHFRVNLIEIILTFSLIYYGSLLIQAVLCYLIVYIDSNFNLFNSFDISAFDNIFNMANNNNVPNDNIPRGPRDPKDIPSLIRYLAGNIAALAARRPAGRMIAVTIVNDSNIILDVLSNEERANYWVDQFLHFRRTGRLRGGQEAHGPFERGTDPFPPVPENSDAPSGSSTELIPSNNSSKFLGDLDFSFDFGFIGNLFTPVEHSMPLNTLLNVHFILNIVLFIIVVSLIILTIYFYVNLIILYNREYFLNNVQNKYILMYVKFVIFKSRVDVVLIGAIALVTLIFIAYVLHYLIVHPIIL